VGDSLRRLGMSWRVTRRTEEGVFTIYVEQALPGRKEEGEVSAQPENQ
jgi:hypothetical protein